jgi:hypothetical protein
LDPARVPAALTVPIRGRVRKGDVVAEGRSLFGLSRTRVPAPVDGSVESVSHVTGQLILREPPLPVEVDAYVRGTVSAVLPGEGAIVETHGALLQGIFGVGGETFGALALAVGAESDDLTPDRLGPGHRGCVVVGGARVSHEALVRARELGAAAVVAGGMDDRDLRRLLGRELGVAVTGSEDLGLTVILTEGFGRIPMASRSFRLLAAHEGQVASVSGATQIRAGVLRPEIIVPTAAPVAADAGPGPGTLAVGAPIRAIRAPHFGRLGKVVELPPGLHPLETEAMVRVLVVEFEDDGTRVRVPRANVERIAE